MIMRRFSPGLAAAVTLAGAVVSCGGRVGAEEPPAQAADAIWRSIFARPGPRAADPQESLRQELGAVLFFDRRLSRDGDRSCATCHQPEKGFSDGLPRARGRDGSALRRNTPHLFNLAEATSFYWDGREPTLEAQARVPLTADNELAADLPRTLRRLADDRELKRLFAQAFPAERGISEASVLAALAAYERSLVSPRTRFDAWVGGDDGALTETERKGLRIFVGKGGCVACHGGWRMTDDSFHDIGLRSADPGRSAVAGGTVGIAAFKTPGLRQVAKTAPYMHDGSLASLEDVVAHYAGRLEKRPSLAANVVRDLKLDADERAALVAFLRTL